LGCLVLSASMSSSANGSSLSEVRLARPWGS